MTPRQLRQALNLSGPVFYLQAIAGGLMIAAVVSLPVMIWSLTR